MHAALHWLTVAVVLLATLAVGVCVHELLHVVPLSFTDAEYAVTVLPDAGDGSALKSTLSAGLVRVEVTRAPDATPDWLFRVAALLPLVLALPLALAAVGVVPNPVAAGDRVATVALIGLTACGLPSPADWSVVWHGSDLVEE